MAYSIGYMKVLIADDDSSVRSIVKSFLETQGHEVMECSNGTEVLEYLSRHELPPLIFLDWTMPKMSGIEVCTRIKTSPNLPYIHVVMITAKSEPADITACLHAGANDYVNKPISSIQELQIRLQIGIQMVELNQLIERQKMQLIGTSKMGVLVEMASNLAHEINNPLAIINGNIQLLHQHLQNTLSGADPMPTPNMLSICNTVIQTTQRITKIIKSLRTFASDIKEEPFELLSVKNLVDHTLSLCISKIRNNDIAIEKEQISNDLFFEGQNVQMQHALINLINNAFTAVKDQKEKWIKIEAFAEEDNIFISITDSGNGIPLHLNEKIMQPFFTTQDPGKGTGLGLSVSMGIIKAHHGNIHVDSSCKNTKFIVKIPKKQQSAG